MKKVFLGGTCNNSLWRDKLIPLLKIDYFNPVVKVWTDEAQQKELHERQSCDFCLYVITPRLKGMYSIAEAVDDSNKRPEKTVFCFLPKDGELEFTEFQLKSLTAVGEMITKNKAKVCANLNEVAEYVNSC